MARRKISTRLLTGFLAVLAFFLIPINVFSYGNYYINFDSGVLVSTNGDFTYEEAMVDYTISNVTYNRNATSDNSVDLFYKNNYDTPTIITFDIDYGTQVSLMENLARSNYLTGTYNDTIDIIPISQKFAVEYTADSYSTDTFYFNFTVIEAEYEIVQYDNSTGEMTVTDTFSIPEGTVYTDISFSAYSVDENNPLGADYAYLWDKQYQKYNIILPGDTPSDSYYMYIVFGDLLIADSNFAVRANDSDLNTPYGGGGGGGGSTSNVVDMIAAGSVAAVAATTVTQMSSKKSSSNQEEGAGGVIQTFIESISLRKGNSFSIVINENIEIKDIDLNEDLTVDIPIKVDGGEGYDWTFAAVAVLGEDSKKLLRCVAVKTFEHQGMLSIDFTNQELSGEDWVYINIIATADVDGKRHLEYEFFEAIVLPKKK